MVFDIFWMNVAAVFAFVNVALVFMLIWLYYQSWRRLRSTFTISLMLFAVFFLVQNLVIIVFWYALYGLVPAAQGIVVAGTVPRLDQSDAKRRLGQSRKGDVELTGVRLHLARPDSTVLWRCYSRVALSLPTA